MPVVDIAIILILTLVNGVFALSEMAVVSSRKARLEGPAKTSRSARAALDLVADPGRFLSTVQIGITLVGIFAGAFGGATLAGPLARQLDNIPFLAQYSETAAIFIVVVAITYLSLVIGELVPKRIALAAPERIAVNIARPMAFLSRLAAPAVWLLRVSTDGVLRLAGLSGLRQAAVTEEEVKALVAEGAETGVFAPAERTMIEGVLRLADRSVSVIMTQRSAIVWLDRGASREALLSTVESSPHSDFLVCDGSVDNALGLVGARDLLAALLQGKPLDLATVYRPALFVSAGTPVLKLIELFRREGVRTAVVVDEYGATEGIVTATDVLAGIAGSLPTSGEAAGPMVMVRADGSWLVDGLMPIDEFEDVCGLAGLGARGDFETVAGFVIHELRRLPEVGDRIEAADRVLEVVDMDGRRVDKILVTPNKETLER